ncbi:splicing regulatory glutamine/lysine-rich protein 1 isoform X1 [Procambarus clarkii]|uniref:splicing regulatory glutamine/lysine-rich protein 1 isoform X1 n=2 Tax=Procambarus clarkii TaxID=6728 RepID=UPI0037430E89
MEESENKRIRKSVNYAEVFGDSKDEDDFEDFTPPPKKKKESGEMTKKTGVGDIEKNMNGYHSDKEKKEKRDDRKPEKERYRDGRDKKEKEKSRDGKEKKEKDRSRDERDKKEKDKSRDSDKDRDRHRHRRDDKYRDKQDREKERSKHDRERENKERKYSDDKKRYLEKENDKKTEESNKSKLDKNSASPISFSCSLTSTQKSPSRTTTTKRLTIEEKLFQRELDAALVLSRLDSGDATDFEKQPDKRKMTVDTKAINRAEGSVCSMLPESKDTLETKHSTLPLSDSVQNQDAEVNKQKYPISPQDKSAITTSVITKEAAAHTDLLEVTKLECNAGNKNEEPQPCTSAGITSKRQRKTVVFKEDTDSDSFDGFSEGANHDSDFSEGSDFAPSPKKKKTRERKTTKNGKSSKSTTKPEKNKGSNLKCSPIRIATTSAAKENNAPQVQSLAVVQNVSKVTPLRNSSAATPRSPLAVTPRSPSAVTPCSPLIVSKEKTTNSSSTFARGKSKITVDSKTVTSPSSGIPRVSVGLVKTPFRSPLLQSLGNSSSSSCTRSSLGNNRNTGLRLGLSRRTNVTPLHPSVSGK